MIDGQGNTLMPGIIDSHFHLFYGSMGLNALRLDEVKSLAKLMALVQQQAADNPDLAWIEGGGLAYDVLGEEPLSRRHLELMTICNGAIVFSH